MRPAALLSTVVLVLLQTNAFADDAAPPAAAPTEAATAPSPAPPATPVSEEKPPEEKKVHVDLGAGTLFPLAFAAEGTVELPYRILVQGDLGWMPAPYSNTIVNVLGTFGAINPLEEDLIKTALKSSFVGRLSAGWRPFPKLGLELLAGYTLVTAGGSLSPREALGAYLEQKGSGSKIPDDAGRQIPLHTTMHTFHATVGWRFLFFDDKLVLRASLGYLQCLGSNSGIDVTPRTAVGQAVINKVNSELSSYLDGYYSTYVKAPIIGVSAAYRF